MSELKNKKNLEHIKNAIGLIDKSL